MELHPSVVERLARLAPDQRAAATAPPGPLLCVAPAGSGKTTTLVARVAWLIASGAATPDEIAAITFNTRAAEELRERLASALEPLGVETAAVRVRTFHALGLEILRDSGEVVEPLVDRLQILRRVAPAAGPAGWRALDTAISRLKLDLGVTADEVAADDEAGPVARAYVRYERAVAATGGLDFDDLVARALALLESSPAGPWAMAGSLRASPRRRGPGPRPGAAPARAAAGHPGQPRLLRRRRRSIDLRLAAGRRPSRPFARRRPARAAPGRPRRELPLPADRRPTRRPPRRAQPGAIREDDRGRPGGVRVDRPRPRFVRRRP
jgi:hypothetical protein